MARAPLPARALAGTWSLVIAFTFSCVALPWLLLWPLTLPLELAFRVYLAARVRMLQRRKQHVPASLRARMTRQERAASLTRVLAAVAATHGGGDAAAAGADAAAVGRFLSLWHFGAPADALRRDNMRRFLAAHFLFCELEELSATQRDELEDMLREVEAATGRAFPEGNADVAAMRVSMPAEPLRWVHWPLGVYASFRAVHSVAHAALRLAGFRHHTAGVLSYYHRAATRADAPPPVVLLPGIGIGVAGYVPMLFNVLCSDGCAAFVVELPHVAAGRLHGVVPEEEAVVDSLLLMLARHAPPATSARWVAHSYGSFVLAWLLRRGGAAAAAVCGAILLDPVAVLIAFPHVLHGAVYRAPFEAPLAALCAATHAVTDVAGVAAAAAEGAAAAALRTLPRLRARACRAAARARAGVQYVVTKEAHIALSVQCHTFWPSASLWLDDLPHGCHVTVVLSEGDALLPVRDVARYAKAVAARRAGELRLEVLWMARHEHGEVALNPRHWPQLAAALAAALVAAPPEAADAAPPHGE